MKLELPSRRIVPQTLNARRAEVQSSLKTLKNVQRLGLKDGLPLRCDESVTVFLRVAAVQSLRYRGRVIDVAIRVASHEDMLRMGRLFDVQADLHSDFSRKGHELEVAHSQATDLGLDGRLASSLGLCQVLLQQCQIGIQPSELLHAMDVRQVVLDQHTIVRIQL